MGGDISTPTSNFQLGVLCLNLHESFVVFVNFEDVEVVFGLDVLLDGAVVGGDRHHARQILKAPLAVHTHLNILTFNIRDGASVKPLQSERTKLDILVWWWVGVTLPKPPCA